MIRLNQNARTELAVEVSLHPISCCALKGAFAQAPPVPHELMMLR